MGRDRCKLKENKESKPNQVSGSDSGGNNDDDTFIDNSVSLSTDEISEDSENIRVNHNEDTGKCSENINNEVMNLSLIHI